MHRFYVPPEQCRHSRVTLPDREAHHALHVLRVRRGDVVTVLDGAGGEYVCETAELDRSSVQLTIHETRTVAPPVCQVTLLQAIPKGKTFDSIIQKATELGVHRIVPLLSARVILELDRAKAEARLEHWRSIAIESIKQCGSPWLPRIEAPCPLKMFLDRQEPFDLSLIATLQADGRHPRLWFSAFRKAHKRLPRSAGLWIGPEGDFTPDEIMAAKNTGARPMTLGRLVLRSETAAIYCLAILNYELDDAAVS